MTHVMCNHWKMTLTLMPLAPLTMFSLEMGYLKTNVTRFAKSVLFPLHQNAF